MKPQEVKAVEAEIDSDPIDSAIYEVESSRNPKAKNPKSSASGGFQLIKSMAKSLGVEDPFDLRQNYEGYKKLRAEHEKRFGKDPKVLYGAHFLGGTLLAKYLNGKKLNSKEQRILKEFKEKALPRFERIYSRIAKNQQENENV